MPKRFIERSFAWCGVLGSWCLTALLIWLASLAAVGHWSVLDGRRALALVGAQVVGAGLYWILGLHRNPPETGGDPASGRPYPIQLRATAVLASTLIFTAIMIMDPRIRGVGDRNSAAQPQLWLDLGKNLAAIIGGVLAIFALYYTDRRHRQTDTQLELTRQGNITERFTRAVEMLGAMRDVKKDGKEISEPNLEVRLGGIYALERLAQDSIRDLPTIIELLCGYVRENSRWDTRKEDETLTAFDDWSKLDESTHPAGFSNRLPRPRFDVQAALTVIVGIPTSHARHIHLPAKNLQYADLRGLNLFGANFERADLRGAHLDGSYLRGASFVGAILVDCCFRGSNLVEADFSRSHISRASFHRAYTGRANFETSIGLIKSEIYKSAGTIETVLPPGWQRPREWISSLNGGPVPSDFGGDPGNLVPGSADPGGAGAEPPGPGLASSGPGEVPPKPVKPRPKPGIGSQKAKNKAPRKRKHTTTPDKPNE